MISLVICSIDPVKFKAVSAMYAAALAGESWELIAIQDARSIAEAYNRAVDQSRGEFLVFSHDDVEILSPNLGPRLRQHLATFDIIGIAGTRRVTGPIWTSAGPPHLAGQIAFPRPDGSYAVSLYGTQTVAVGKIQSVDGVFMAARRSVFASIRFDAHTYDGFHGWDQDFCLRAYHGGMKLGVANDIGLSHASTGSFDAKWETYARRFIERWSFAPESIAIEQNSGWSAVIVASKSEAMAAMTPDYWLDELPAAPAASALKTAPDSSNRPAISIIVHNTDVTRFNAVSAMYADSLADESWEMIGLSGPRSVADAYNRGIDQSRGDILVFSHDDVEVLSPSLGPKLREYLSTFDIIGVVGARRAVGPLWASAGPPHLAGQFAAPQPDGSILVNILAAPTRVMPNIQSLDGFFMAARRPVAAALRFDAATFKGFRAWDADFCRRAIRSGFTIGIANDINLLHTAIGEPADDWTPDAIKFAQKWSLPPESWKLVHEFNQAWTRVKSKAAALEAMTPGYWLD